MLLQHQGWKPFKTRLFTLRFSECVESTVFCCDVFRQGAQDVSLIWCFLHFYGRFQLPKQTSQEHWYLQCFEKTKSKNTTFWSNSSHFSSSCSLIQKKSQFRLCFCHPPLIRTQPDVKSQHIVRLQQAWTFCLSQSLPQSSNSKNWGRRDTAPKDDINCNVLWTYHAFYLPKRWPRS